MALEKQSRMSRSAKLAALRQKLVTHIEDLQRKIARLTPLKHIAELLVNGHVSSAWFVQRLVDSGLSLEQAVEELGKIRHGPGGDKVDGLPESVLPENPMPIYPTVHRGTTRAAKQARIDAPHLRLCDNCTSETAMPNDMAQTPTQ